jgi:hypothetical protein
MGREICVFLFSEMQRCIENKSVPLVLSAGHFGVCVVIKSRWQRLQPLQHYLSMLLLQDYLLAGVQVSPSLVEYFDTGLSQEQWR